mgnify:CR=1 FL=1
MSATLLIADIGGTNARFALADPHAATPLLDDSVREFAVADFPSLADAARHYLDQAGAHADRGVFAVAGRVDGDEARITNHPWVISVNRTRQALGFQGLKLVNDFAAQAMAVSLLTPRDVVAIGGTQLSGGVGRLASCSSSPARSLTVSPSPTIPPEHTLIPASRTLSRVSRRSW